LKNSSSLKCLNVHQTGTFKADVSNSDKTQSIDKFGNEVREFAIGHPPVNYQAQSSYRLNSTDSQRFNTIESRDNKENKRNVNIEIDTQGFKIPQKVAYSTRNNMNFGELGYQNNENLPKPFSHNYIHINGNFLK